jgi:hypothetical protein
MSVQFCKSEPCCITKFVEGTVHESAKLPFIGVMFIVGVGVENEVYIGPGIGIGCPPKELIPSVATAILFPSAEQAIEPEILVS